WSSQLCLGPYIKNTDIFLAPIDRYVPDITTHSAEAPIPNTRRVAPISYMANSLSTEILTQGNSGQCSYFPSVPNPVTNCQGPISPGGWYTTSPNSVSSTSADSPSDLILFT